MDWERPRDLRTSIAFGRALGNVVCPRSAPPVTGGAAVRAFSEDLQNDDGFVIEAFAAVLEFTDFGKDGVSNF